MNKVSNSKILQIITRLLILIALAKLLSLVLLWYLPSNGVDVKLKKSYYPLYQRVSFENMLTPLHTKSTSYKKTKEIGEHRSITDMSLIGLYGSKNYGYAIVAMKSNLKKTSIIAVGETYNGYTLKEINEDNVVFTKNAKEYILHFAKQKNKNVTINRVTHDETDNGVANVSRSDITFFEKNPQKIWKEIAINEVVKDGKIKGFKIMRIDKNSKFAALGLQKGDVIIRANNVDLTSYKAVMDIYKNINRLSEIDLVLLRNNTEKELVYEIH